MEKSFCMSQVDSILQNSAKNLQLLLPSLFQPIVAMSYGSFGNVGSFSNLLTHSDVVPHLDKSLFSYTYL